MPTWLRIAIIIALVVTLPIVALVLVLVRGNGDGEEEDDGVLSAAIVDQLSVTVPNQSFADSAKSMLEEAGYTVDYYPGNVVTVEFYRQLPYHAYDLILFRSHADRLEATDEAGNPFDQVVLFTSEPYTEMKYQNEQSAHDLVIARYERGGEPFFGVAAGFIEELEDGFDGAQIVMMGCEGMLNETMGAAFVERGAQSYISWNKTVSATHTDAATETLLGHLLDGSEPNEAVAQTMSEVGPDPEYDSVLLAYPATE